MKRVTILTLLPALMLFVTGCGDTPESIMDDMVSLFEDTAKVLASVKSEKDVKSAEAKLKKLVKEAEDLQKRAKKVKDPSEADQKKLMKKYMPKILSAGMKMQKEAERIATIPGGERLAAQVQNIGKALGGGMGGMK